MGPHKEVMRDLGLAVSSQSVVVLMPTCHQHPHGHLLLKQTPNSGDRPTAEIHSEELKEPEKAGLALTWPVGDCEVV